MAGDTSFVDFPGTAGGAQAANAGGTDAFVARLTSDGQIEQATYLGGSVNDFGGSDEAIAVAIHPTTGDVYIAGTTNSTDFPWTAGGAQPIPAQPQNAFVTRLPADLRPAATSHADLTITKSHVGNFIQGASGRTYTITVTNVGTGPTTGPVSVHDSLPTGLTATALGGSGWSCTLGTLTCTRSDVLAATGASYPAITLTVNVAVNAASSVTNTATVSGGSDINPANNLASDPTTVTAGSFADLVITKTHTGFFLRGQTGSYTITVQNVGSAPTNGSTTVTDTLPAGLSAVTLSSPGWACTLDTLTCTRNDVLPAQASYPPITLTVNVAGNASRSVTNTVAFSGVANFNPSPATDETTIITFFDVTPANPFIDWIEAVASAGITGGCAINPPRYCPDAEVTRGQMAVFLLRGIHGAGYQPPEATGMFADVPVDPPSPHVFAKWIEQLAREGITAGCSTSPPMYCPNDVVTRGQMAVFLLRARHGTGYQPPVATGMFDDVPIAGPSAHPFAKWIEQLARDGITGGCATSPARYCPNAGVTRAQMAVFLVRTFTLPP